MSALSRYLARFVWWWCLWLMRRPWMKFLQSTSVYFFPPSKRARAHQRFVTQNAFARRHGVGILTLIFNLFFGYVLVLVVYVVTIDLVARDFFTLPRNVADRVSK